MPDFNDFIKDPKTTFIVFIFKSRKLENILDNVQNTDVTKMYLILNQAKKKKS